MTDRARASGTTAAGAAGAGGAAAPAPGRPVTSRRTSPRRRLIRAGFADVARAACLLEDPALAACLQEPVGAGLSGAAGPGAQSDRGRQGRGEADPGGAREALIDELAQCADPDLGLLTLVRLAQACAPAGHQGAQGTTGTGRTDHSRNAAWMEEPPAGRALRPQSSSQQEPLALLRRLLAV